MNLSGLFLGFVMVSLVVLAIILIGTQYGATPYDTYGGTQSVQANNTNLMMQNVTGIGTAASGGAIIVIACLVVFGSIAMVWVKSRS